MQITLRNISFAAHFGFIKQFQVNYFINLLTLCPVKHLYAFLSTVLVCASASAEIFDVTVSDKTMPDRSFNVLEREKAGDYYLNIGSTVKATIDVTKKDGIKKAEPGDTWLPLGKGKFVDDFFTVLDGFSIETWEVEMYENADAPGYYAMENPYMVSGNPYESLGAINTAYWIVDARDPNKVDLNMYNPGIDLSGSELGIVLVGGWPAFLDIAGQPENITDDMYGKLVEGTMTFPKCVYYLSGYNGGTGFERNGCKILLPGADTFTAELTLPQCSKDNKATLEAKFTGNVKETKFYLAEGRFPASDANVAYAAKNGSSAGSRLEFKLSLNGSVYTENKVLTVFIVGLDADGNVLCYDYGYYDIIVDDSENWTDIGTGKMTDNFISGFYTVIPQQTIDVKVQEHKTQAGYYRIVNPFDGLDPEPMEDYHESDHAHYMYVHAEDPYKVYITDSPVGIDLGYGVIRINSVANNYLTNGQTVPSGTYGTLKNRVITFPTKKLVIGEYENKSLGYYYTNNNGSFSLEIPETGGMNSIVADGESDARATYYNLQGAQIDNPQPGTLVIKRCGSKVSKEIVR